MDLPMDIVEVILMIDLSNKTIENLFYKQMRDLSVPKEETFDMQFSGGWI